MIIVPKQYKNQILTQNNLDLLLDLCKSDNFDLIHAVVRCIQGFLYSKLNLIIDNPQPQMNGFIVMSESFHHIMKVFSSSHLSAINETLNLFTLIVPGNSYIAQCATESNFLTQIISQLEKNDIKIIIAALQLLITLCDSK